MKVGAEQEARSRPAGLRMLFALLGEDRHSKHPHLIASLGAMPAAETMAFCVAPKGPGKIMALSPS